MELYKSKFATINLSENQIIEQIWDASTVDMTNEDFKNEQLQFRYFIEKHKPVLLYTDAVNFQFVISIEIQEWNSTNLLQFFSSIGGKKIAILITSDILTQLSIEQALDDPTINFKTRYFDNEYTAKNWLLEK